MTATVSFTPTDLIKPIRTTSLEIFDLKSLIDGDILAWSNLLSSESSSALATDSPLTWSPDRRSVPLLKPAVPKSYKSPQTDAQILLSFVEETLKEDVLKDWEPFDRDTNPGGRKSRYPVTIEVPSVAPKEETLIPSPSPRNFLNVPNFFPSPVSATSLYSRLSDEGTRLSTPVDWKPFHPSSPLYDRSLPDPSFPKSVDDCLASQGDTAKARRKRRKRAFEISGDLIPGRNKQLVSSEFTQLALLREGLRKLDLSGN